MIKPIRDFIYCEYLPFGENETKIGSLIIKQDEEQFKFKYMKVLEVGEGRYLECGIKEEITAKPGDVLVIADYSGIKVTGSDPTKKFFMVKWNEVLGLKDERPVKRTSK